MTDTNVIDLKGKPVEPTRTVNPAIVKMLEECLVEAREGRLVQCAVVFRQDDGHVDHCIVTPIGLSVDHLIGRLEVAKAELIAALFQEKPFQ